MLKVRDYSIQRKLTLMNMVVSGAALLLACTAFGTYELTSARNAMVRSLSIQAQIVGANSAPSLLFGEAEVARNSLSALNAAHSIVYAGLYRLGGEAVGVYWRNGSERRLPLPTIPGRQTEVHWFTKTELVLIRTTEFQGIPTGAVYMRADLQELSDRLWRYAGAVGAVLSLSMVAAFLLASMIQGAATQPILKLAETARIVSRKKEYTLRAPATGNHDEVSVLIDAFNDMLAQIQARDAALRAHLERLDLVDRITRSIAERQDLLSIFQVVLRSLEDSLRIDFGCVFSEAGASALTVTCVGERSEALSKELGLTEQTHIEACPDGMGRCMNGQLVYDPDLSRSHFDFAQRLAGRGLRSLVAAPLQSEGKVFGILIAARQQPHGFSSGDCEFLRQLSEHVALAGHQAQIYAALQRAYDELKLTQQAVMQQERLRVLGQMASGIAHDINNALSPVALYTDSLLEREPNLSARGRGYLQIIQRAWEDVTHTVKRMQEFYREREPQLMLLPVDLNRLVPQVLDLTRARWSDMPQQRGIVIQAAAELAPDLPNIAGIESEIRDALVNLIFNAVDAMPDGGTLTLRTRASRELAFPQVQVEVEDTGFGMDEETRRRCLELFFSTKGKRGSGLGLAMVFGVTTRHNAELEIHSTPGKGTRVRMIFPMPPVALEPVPDETPPSMVSPQRILLVDDDLPTIESLRATLAGDGHSIVTAHGGQEGIDAFRAAESGQPFDLVITDLGMPRIDGTRVASTVKAVRASVPVILLTGWGQRLAAEMEVPPGVDRVLSKPPKLRELRLALAELVSAPA